jgi:hypothetical protein
MNGGPINKKSTLNRPGLEKSHPGTLISTLQAIPISSPASNQFLFENR